MRGRARMNTERNVDGTRTVETTIDIDNVAPERVIEAFLRDDDLTSSWKVSRCLVVPVAGGVWSVAWDGYGEGGTNHSWYGVIRQLDTRRLLIAPLVQNEPDRPLFGPLSLEIVATPIANGTNLTVRHSGYQRGEHWLHDAVVQGWAGVLANMKAWFQT